MSLRQHQGLALELGASACLVAAEAEMWSGAQEMSWYQVFRYGERGLSKGRGDCGREGIRVCGTLRG